MKLSELVSLHNRQSRIFARSSVCRTSCKLVALVLQAGPRRARDCDLRNNNSMPPVATYMPKTPSYRRYRTVDNVSGANDRLYRANLLHIRQ